MWQYVAIVTTITFSSLITAGSHEKAEKTGNDGKR